MSEDTPNAPGSRVQDGADADANQAGRIEGGIDAIVIGAGVDGLTAAAYLGKAGLRTVLVSAGVEIGGAIAAREVASGVEVVDGEHLVTLLDPQVIAELDLYRHGLDYAARRLDTTYFFDGGDALRLDGDLAQAAYLSLDEDNERDALHRFMNELLEAAVYLRPAFRPAVFSSGDPHYARALEKALGHAPLALSARIRQYLFSSVRDIVEDRFTDGPLRQLLYAEGAFRSGAAPHEAFSFMSIVRRLSGEAAGLQGASAYPSGGAVAVVSALRRAAQAAKVDVRAATPVSSILIEGDRVAGVMLKDGGQLRAPLLVASNSAAEVFLELIGGASIDIELQRVLSAQRAEISSARLHLVLKGVAQDDATKENLLRRLFYAPNVESVTSAFMEARAGRVPEKLIIEALFPSALDDHSGVGAGSENRQVMSVLAHPVPFDARPDDARREAIKQAILTNIENFASGLSERIEVADLRLPDDDARASGSSAEAFAAKPDMMRQWALTSTVAASGQIGGLYCCGPEAQIGAGISCASARASAKAALRAYKKGVL